MPMVRIAQISESRQTQPTGTFQVYWMYGVDLRKVLKEVGRLSTQGEFLFSAVPAFDVFGGFFVLRRKEEICGSGVLN